MRRLEFRQRYFTDIGSIAVGILALFQRSVMDLKKCAKQIKKTTQTFRAVPYNDFTIVKSPPKFIQIPPTIRRWETIIDCK